jgi:hypothetical protein
MTAKHSIEHLGHQHTSLAQIQHELNLGGQQLFNTGISVRDAYQRRDIAQGLQISVVNGKDFHEASERDSLPFLRKLTQN